MFLPGILSNLANAFPGLKLYIIESGREHLLKKLVENEVDMIFIPHEPAAKTGLSVKKIGMFEIACCVPAVWKLSKQKTIKATDLSNVQIVLFSDSFFQTDIIKKWFLSYNIEPNVILQTEQLSTVQSLVSSGIAAGFLFKNISRSVKNVSYISLDDKIYTDVNVIWKKDNYMSDTLELLSEYISNVSNYNN